MSHERGTQGGVFCQSTVHSRHINVQSISVDGVKPHHVFTSIYLRSNVLVYASNFTRSAGKGKEAWDRRGFPDKYFCLRPVDFRGVRLLSLQTARELGIGMKYVLPESFCFPQTV